MEENLLLDYAIFNISSSQNRYDSIICGRGKTEKFVSGPLAPLSLFLQDAKEFKSSSSNGSFKLQFKENIRDSSWFNKSILARFLHAVNSTDMVKSAEAILNEMSQLEETRKFHLSLYSKANTGAVTSEATKNELIRALDLRLTALNEETAVAFIRSLGSNLYSNEISNLSSFLLHFCPQDLRNLLSNHIKTLKPSEPNTAHQNQPKISPAKLAQTEREISSESETEQHSNNKQNKNYSSDSEQEEEEIQTERSSRPAMRAPSPRRSASPMRRVQIGRSGSRRAQAISIKSLSYFPTRDRAGFDRDLEDAEGEDNVKRTEVNVTRMSVKDAISMFECKKSEEGGERKGSLGFGGVNKAVLRRWSSSNAESRNKSENETENGNGNGDSNDELVLKNNDLVSEGEKKGEESAEKGESEKHEREMEAPVSVLTGEEKCEQNESADKAVTSAEWNRQKEAELNEMLMKIMGVNSKPGKYGLTVKKSTEQKKGDISAQNKDLREEKTLVVKTVKTRRPVQGNNTANKPTVVSKKGNVTKEKRISPIPPNRAPRRNSAPQIAPKKEVLKPNTTPVSSKRASPRSSPVPSSSLTKSTNNSLNKTKSSTNLNTSINTSINSTTPISRRKPQNTPTSSQPSPKRTERAVVKPKKEIGGEIKAVLKGQTENKPKTTVRASNNNNNIKGTKLKNSPSSLGEDAKSKPSFYNKVTKKSSVVPLESKPNLRKTTVSAKNKLNSNISPSPKSSIKSLVQSQDKEEEPVPAPVIQDSAPKVNESQPETKTINPISEPSPKNEPNNPEPQNPETESHFQNPGIEIPIPISTTTEILQPEEEISIISSDAWVEEDQQEQIEAPVESETGDNQMNEMEASSEIEMEISSPKIRHSLSQMLQAEIQEPEMIEWGNAENPPALVFQKDSPKGFKRLLKFARKSNNNGYNLNNKGEVGSVNSEGEEEGEAVVNMRSLGGLSAKGAVVSGEGFDGGSKRGVDGKRSNGGLSAQSSGSNLSFRDAHVSSAKASRSFFSLSNFRSSKSNETKPR
ncbi:hypothetical protein LUZ60_013164 [Juncus effusus]|nr:hypothetical protein LUZ60_013164 [Juncus effusus]